MKIAWTILCYQKPDHILKIIDAIYQDGDSIFIHYDKKSSKSEYRELKEKCAHLPHVYIYQKYKVFWGDVSVMYAENFLIKKLYQKKIDYDYIINLTGTTYPVRPISELRDFLIQEYPKSFLYTFPLEDLTSKNVLDDSKVMYLKEQYFLVQRNLKYILIKAQKKRFTKLEEVRFSLMELLVKIKKKLYNKNIIPLLFSFPKIYSGSAHIMISKSHMELMRKSSFTITLFLLELTLTQCPDEIFYQTALKNCVNENEIIDNNYLYTDWSCNNGFSPCSLTEKDMPKIIQDKKYFFARKIEDINVMKEIDKIIKR